ncbi:MAG: type III pantothenate kinase [Christensenellaceae bacterium]|jgi:type III pantothenate kinase|nr:type III pantothenate kinase [Christensenellaceae bacterium]
MVLLLDIGNTNIKIGVVNDNKLVKTWRVASDHNKTADEFGMIFLDLLSSNGFSFDEVEGMIMSSVAPALNYTIEHMCEYYTKKRPIMVNSKLNLGIKINYLVPDELGADRILNAVAAHFLYGGPAIIIDFGSATTFGYIDDEGAFLGGAIAPGIKSSAESLTNTAAKLPRIELVRPKSVIGRTTVENMQSGIIFGFTGLVQAIVDDMRIETGNNKAKIIATGGMCELITPGAPHLVDIVDRTLSLQGLKILYDMNKKK